MDRSKMSLVMLDTETTGLSPKKDRVVEVAACRIDAVSGGVVEEFHRYVNPGMRVPAAAVKIHGITDEFLEDKPRFEAIATELKGFLEGSTIVIHNAPFDTGFLSAEYAACGAEQPFGSIPERIVCTRAMAKRILRPGQSASLDALCDLFGIDRSSRSGADGASVHGALIDCRLLAKVYVRLEALAAEREERITGLLPFARGAELPEGIEELAKGYLALEQAMRPLNDELKRIEAAVKKACNGTAFLGKDAAVTFTPSTRTNWPAVVKAHLAAVDLSRYQKSSPRMHIKATWSCRCSVSRSASPGRTCPR